MKILRYFQVIKIKCSCKVKFLSILLTWFESSFKKYQLKTYYLFLLYMPKMFVSDISSRKMDEAKFLCECGKSYLYSSSLYNHKTYFCGKERQFSCPLCSYRSSQKGTLKRHFYVKHKNDIHPLKMNEIGCIVFGK